MSSPSILTTNDPYKGRGQGHVTLFKFWGPNDGTKLELSNFAHRWNVSNRKS